LTYVIDACALVAFLNEEKGEGYEAVDDLLNRAEAGEITLYMSVVNLVEVYYGYIQDKGIETANKIMEPVKSFPIEIIYTISDTVYHQTARYKGLYSMSLADAFACATAKSLSATLVTKDGEIEALEQGEGFPILWIN
jgi:predicted nucleic acid-binding protein